ncbi:MAG: ATP-binding protein [Gemmatimonadaceae bacterium]
MHQPRLSPLRRPWRIGLVLASTLWVTAAAAQTPGTVPDRRILMIDYGDPNRPGFVPLNSAFLARIRGDSGIRPIIYREHHDPRVGRPSSFDATALDIWSDRYAGIPLDAIVANGPTELGLAIRLRSRLARDLPIIYRASTAVPPPQLGHLSEAENATGVVDPPLIAPILREIRRLLPDLRRLVVVSQNESDVTLVETQAGPLLDGVTLHPWMAPSLSALRDSVSRLAADAAVLYVAVFIDGEGRVWTPADFLEAFASASARPVFGLYLNLVGRGIIGGPVIDRARQGAIMAARTLAVLKDPDIARRRVVDTIPGWTPTYDWRELTRHGISAKRLPAGAIVVEAPIPIWRGHPVAFWTVTLLVALQTLSIAGLITNRRAIRLATRRQRALTRRLQLTQEEEQARLSRDLHDTLGQDLLGQALDLERYAPTATAPHQATFATRLRQSVARLESIARELHPSALRWIDLRTGIQQLASDLQTRTGIAISVAEHGLDRPLPDEVRAVVFRIIQEALTNVRRHAQAANVMVMIDARGATLEAIIRDDGIGFDASRPSESRLGLLGMQERAAAVGGRVLVTAMPNDGTTVSLLIPLPTRP